MSLTEVPLRFALADPATQDPADGDVTISVPTEIVDATGNVVYHKAYIVYREPLVAGEVTIDTPATDQPGTTSAGYVNTTVRVLDSDGVVLQILRKRVAIAHDTVGTLQWADLVPVTSSGLSDYASAAALAAEALARAAADAAHEADTTNVHGIVDTATFVTAAAVIAADSYVRGAGGARGVEGRTPAEVRTDLSLGGAALLNVGTTAGTVAAGDDARLSDTRTPTDNSVTSAKIVNGTIVNDDVNASAAIALSKLATDPLARANHTGTQLAATVSDFDTQVATTAVLKALVDAKGDLIVGTAADTLARLAVGTAGYVPVADPAATSGLAYFAKDPNAYATGQNAFERMLAVSSRTMTSGTVTLTYFTATRAETIANIAAQTHSTAAGATPTLCRMGVYSVAANGDLTLVAACANDTALFAGANTRYTRALTASYSAVLGQRYAFAVLVVTGAAQPTMVASAPFNGFGAVVFAIAPRESGGLAAQSDLPASISAGSVATASQAVFGEVLP